MKRNVFVVSLAFLMLVSACGPQATPTVNPADIQATAQAAAFTQVAQTLQAQPTNTPLPPTETPSPTLAATNTVPPLPTSATLEGQATAALLPTSSVPSLPTFTQQASSGSSNTNQDPCNQPLTSWQGKTANFTVVNQTKPKGTIILSMYVTTDMGQCGYLIITGDSFTGPTGQYSAGAFVTGDKNVKTFGSFRITEGNWKIIVRNENITAGGSCYPNC